MPKRLTDEEREFKRKERNRKVFDRYKTYDDGKRGDPESWKKIAEIAWGQHSTFEDYFKELDLWELPKSEDDLKKAWKRKMLEAHPDRGGDAKQATKINEAYENLKRCYIGVGVEKNKTQSNTVSPAKASHIEHDDFTNLWASTKYMDNANYCVEVKLDGSRYLLYLDEVSMLLSRRISDVTKEYVDKTLNCPHLTRKEIPKEFWGTVLDGEVVHPTVEKSDATTSIMGCAEDEAVRRQMKNGWLIYRVYDVPRLKGQDITHLPLRERRQHLEKLVEELKQYIPIELHDQYPATDAQSLFEKVVAKGGEGVMLKDLNARYGNGWFKVKKTKTWDVVIMGFSDAKKTSKKVDGTVSETQFHKDNMIGSIIFGMYKDGKLIQLGSCSGMSANVRKELSINGDKYIGAVIEIKGQERTKSGAFRHARFVKFRQDKAAEQCIDDE